MATSDERKAAMADSSTRFWCSSMNFFNEIIPKGLIGGTVGKL
jgi:hypothetical protein